MSKREFVNASGEPVNLDADSASYKAKAKPKSEPSQAYHKGWRVEGHPPGKAAEEEQKAVTAWKAWCAMDAGDQTQRIKAGYERPKPWLLEAWLAATRRKQIGVYGIPSAADAAMAMALKAGWTHVEIVALSRGAVPQQLPLLGGAL